jgi:peptidoglycan/LPS O-acetylase OafA/YrhL
MAREQLAPLTGLRGLAAVMVLAAHVLWIFPRDLGDLSRAMAYAAICGFFVLSGFVITYNYADQFKPGGAWTWAAYSFAVSRFARLYPLYLFILIVAILIVAPGTRCDGAACAVSHLTMTQSWIALQSQTSIALTWSVSTEWFFYLAFLLLVPFVHRLTGSARCGAAFMAVFIAAMVSQSLVYRYQTDLAFLLPHAPGVPEGAMLRWLSYFSPYLRVFDFFLGAVAAKLFMIERDCGRAASKRWSALGAASLFALSVIFAFDACGILRQSWPFLDYLRESHLYAAPLAILLYASAHRPAILSWFGSPLATSIGERSYAIYLSQFFGPGVYGLFGFALIPETSWSTACLRMALLLAVVLVIAELMHRIIDTPARRFLRNALLTQSRSGVPHGFPFLRTRRKKNAAGITTDKAAANTPAFGSATTMAAAGFHVRVASSNPPKSEPRSAPTHR